MEQPAEEPREFVDELKPGTELLGGQYTIIQFLNAGGFGITYLATNSLGREVVIKECFPGSFCRRSHGIVQARSRAHENEFAQIVRLFVQEAQSLSRLIHPNIVGVHQVFEDNHTAYMAIDYIEGRDLLDIIEHDRTLLRPPVIAMMLRKLLGAVAFIHDNGMLHRDISPDNILISASGEPVLIDFGAARQQANRVGRALSALRVVKDGYSPQEFYVSGTQQTPSSDLYAMAATFYHLITGDAPPNSQSRLVAMAESGQDPYRRLAGRFPGYPPGFLEAIDDAISVLPRDRIQSAHDWLDRIATRPELKVVPLAGRGTDSSATPAKAPEAAPAEAIPADAVEAAPTPPRGRSGLPAALLAVALVIGTAGYLHFFEGSEAPEPGPTLPAASEAMPTPAFAPEGGVGPAPVEAEALPQPADTAAAPLPEAQEAAGPAPAASGVTEPQIVPEPSQAVTTEAPVLPPAPTEADATKAPEAAATPPARASESGDAAAPGVTAPPSQTPVPAGPALTRPPFASDAGPAAAQPEPEVTAPAPVPQMPERVQPLSGPEPETAADQTAAPLSAGRQAPVAAQFPGAAAVVTISADARSTAGVGIAAAAETTNRPLTEARALTDPTVAARQVATADWSLVLPFETSTTGEAAAFPVISHMAGDTGAVPGNDWVAEGVTIYAVNGIFVTDQPAIEQALASAGEFGVSRVIHAPARIEAPGDSSFREVELSAPARLDVALVNGVGFRTMARDDAWQTVITGVSTPEPDGLRPGDIVLAELVSGERLGSSRTLELAINRLAMAKHPVALFEVDRDGKKTLARMTLAREGL